MLSWSPSPSSSSSSSMYRRRYRTERILFNAGSRAFRKDNDDDNDDGNDDVLRSTPSSLSSSSPSPSSIFFCLWNRVAAAQVLLLPFLLGIVVLVSSVAPQQLQRASISVVAFTTTSTTTTSTTTSITKIRNRISSPTAGSMPIMMMNSLRPQVGLGSGRSGGGGASIGRHRPRGGRVLLRVIDERRPVLASVMTDDIGVDDSDPLPSSSSSAKSITTTNKINNNKIKKRTKKKASTKAVRKTKRKTSTKVAATATATTTTTTVTTAADTDEIATTTPKTIKRKNATKSKSKSKSKTSQLSKSAIATAGDASDAVGPSFESKSATAKKKKTRKPNQKKQSSSPASSSLSSSESSAVSSSVSSSVSNDDNEEDMQASPLPSPPSSSSMAAATTKAHAEDLEKEKDHIIGSNNHIDDDEIGEEQLMDDDDDDDDPGFALDLDNRKAAINRVLEEQNVQLKEQRRKELWGEFANAKTKDEILQVEQRLKTKIHAENLQKAAVAKLYQGVDIELLEAPDESSSATAAGGGDDAAFDDGKVDLKAWGVSSALDPSTFYDSMDQDLRDEWNALNDNYSDDVGATYEDDFSNDGDGSDTGPGSGIPGTDTVSVNGKIVPRDAMKGIRVGSAGGWSLEVFPGDFVVHRRYGIGRFEGTKLIPRTKLTDNEKKARDKRRNELLQDELRRITKAKGGVTQPQIKEIQDRFGTPLDTDPVSNPQSTVLEITYQDGIVQVPVDRAYRLSRYRAGDSVVKPRLTKVRGDQWKNSRKKVEATTLELAEDVLALYATRETLSRQPADPAKEDDVKVFESTFKFEPTPDQLKCFVDVENDMVWRSRPMDRLVCGDVGFGKTEVAMRAMYRAVLNGQQVAFLAPTGVLASQHYKNIMKRCGEGTQFNRKIALVRGRASNTQAMADLRRQIKDGEIEIIVGTHALLSKDMKYNNLGLLIVDEEQRFGVKQKERLKIICGGIDVLTLSATPIPRTLQMSLSGVRDTSTIRSPPPMRKPTMTYVQQMNDDILKYAIGTELDRGGQCFYVVPRIKMLNDAEQQMKELFPDIRVVQAHGRQKRDTAEENVAAFAEGKYDVLLATTVIENGVDIPSTNTIIVQDSQFFGISTLYQLRGRVGRSDQQAYAYFLCDESKITEQSMLRLQAIGELNELGSGFDVANRDLEIRGAGSLLGTEQSGMAARVGFDLYMRMLKKSIRQLRGLDLPLVPRTKVLLPNDDGAMEIKRTNERGDKVTVNAFQIPDTYIADTKDRQQAESAARLAETSGKLVELTNEWKDTYGPMPMELQSKLKTMHLHACTRRLGIDLIGLVERSDDDGTSKVDCVMRSPGLRPRHWGMIFANGVSPKGINAIFPARFTKGGESDTEIRGGKRLNLKDLMEDSSLDDENWDALDEEETEAQKEISSAYSVTSMDEIDLEQYPRFIIRNFGSAIEKNKVVDRLLHSLLPIAKTVYEIQEKEKEKAVVAAELRERGSLMETRKHELAEAEQQRYYMK